MENKVICIEWKKVICVEWENEFKKYSLHMNKAEADAFVNSWINLGSKGKVVRAFNVLTDEDGLHAIRRGNHGDFVNEDDFIEVENG